MVASRLQAWCGTCDTLLLGLTPDAVQNAVMREQFAIDYIGLVAGIIAVAMTVGVHWSRVKSAVWEQYLNVFLKYTFRKDEPVWISKHSES